MSAPSVCVLKIIKKCKFCGHSFVITQSEVNWMLSKGLEIPKHCPDCRKKRRENNG